MHKKCVKSAQKSHNKCQKEQKMHKDISEDLVCNKKNIENNSNNTSSTAMPQVKGRPRPSTKASMPTRPKWRPTRKENMSHTWVTWANIEMQILPMEKTHRLQLTLGHAQVKTSRHKNITSSRNISQVKQLSQVKNIKEQVQTNTKQYP